MLNQTKSLYQNIRYLPEFFLTPEFVRRFFSSYIRTSLGRFDLDLPININLMITSRCNLNCKICYVKDELNKKKDMLNIKDIRKIQKTFRGRRTLFFLTGGEPTLNKNLVEIIEILKKDKKHYLGLVTNGSILTHKKIDELIQAKVDLIVFSLFGDSKIHSETVGDKHAYKKLIENASYFCKKRKRTYVLLNVPISDELDFENMIEVASEIGVNGIRFSHLIYVTKEQYKKTIEKMHENVLLSNFQYDKIDTRLLIKKIRKVKKSKPEIDLFFHPYLSEKEIKEWYSDDFKQRRKCHFLQVGVHIGSDRQVYPCQHYKYSYGDLGKKDFKEIWNSKKAIEFRKRIHKELLPACSRCIKF